MRRLFIVTLGCIALFAISNLTASAQFVGSVTEFEKLLNYERYPITFKFDEVANQLDVSVEELDSAIGAWHNQTQLSPGFYTLETDGHSEFYNEGTPGGYWLSRDGKISNWGAGGAWFSTFGWNAEANEINFYVGQFPDSLKYGAPDPHAVIAINYNGRSATFDLTLEIKARPTINPVTKISELTILNTVEIKVKQEPRSDNSVDEEKINLDGILQQLGIDGDYIMFDPSAYIYNTQSDVEGFYRLDELTNVSTASVALGWWEKPLYNEEAGGYIGECTSSSWTSECRFFIENVKLNKESETLSFSIGQMPNACAIGDEYYTYLYIINGSNAWCVIITLNIEGTIPFEQKENKGTYQIEVAQYPTNDYYHTAFTVNVDSLANVMGVKASRIKLWAQSADSVPTYEHTADNGGFWMDRDGIVTYWTGYVDKAAVCVEPKSISDLTSMTICQYPNYFNGGDTAKVHMYLMADECYMDFLIDFVILKKPKENKGTYHIAIAQEPTNDYYHTTFYVDVDSLANVMGVDASQITLWAQASEGVPTYEHTAGEGYWMDRNGYVTPWTAELDTAAVCVEPKSMSDLTSMTICQYPNYFAAGDTARIHMYFMADECYMDFLIDLIIKDKSKELPFEEKENKGTYQIAITQYPTNDYYHTTFNVNIDSLANVMGVDATEIKFWAQASEGVPTQEYTAGTGYWMDQNGYVTPWTDYVDKAAVCVESKSQSDLTSMTICQYPNYFAGGETAKIHMYFMANQCYMDFLIDLNITTELPFEKKENKGAYQITINQYPTNDYYHTTFYVDVDSLARTMGVEASQIKLWAQASEGVPTYEHTAGTGYWMDRNGYVTPWTDYLDTAAVCVEPISMSDLTSMTICQYPYYFAGGDTANVHMYFMADKCYMDFLIEFIIEETMNVVGQMNITLPYCDQSGEYAETEVNIQPALEALGCTEEAFYNESVWRTLNKSGFYTAKGWDDIYGFCYNKNGDLVKVGEEFTLAAGFFSKYDSDCSLDVFRSYAAIQEGTYPTSQSVTVNGLTYWFNIVIGPTISAIETVKSSSANSVLYYDMTGRKVSADHRGLLIEKHADGKVVKVFKKISR